MGELPCLTLPSGHRRFRLEDCLSYFEGLSPEDLMSGNAGDGSIAVYVRVSSESQDKAGSLSRQLDRLLTEVSRREGIKRDKITVYKDVASSFGNREGLNRLVDAIIDGRVKRLYCEYQDRLSRVPALTRLVEHLAKRYGVQIVCLDTEEISEDELQGAMKELLAYTTVISNRINARKSTLVTRKNLTPETLARMVELRRENVSLKDIARLLEQEGHVTSKGDPVSYALVRKHLDANGVETALTTATGNTPSPSPFTAFRQAYIIKSDDKARLPVKDLVRAYKRYCAKRGLTPENNARIGRLLADIPRVKSNGQRVLLGVTIKAK